MAIILKARLSHSFEPRDKYLPSTPAHLSKSLARLKPALVKIGVKVEFGSKGREGKRISISLSNDDMKIPSASPG